MTKKHPKIQIHQTLAPQTYHHLKNAQGHYVKPSGRRPNQTAHLRGTQHQRAHFATRLGNMPPPLKLLLQKNNVLHQQAKAKVQGTHNILTTNSISKLHKIEKYNLLNCPPSKILSFVFFLSKLAKLRYLGVTLKNTFQLWGGKFNKETEMATA